MSVMLASPQLDILNDEYYQSHFIATVRFDNGRMIIEGGKKDLKKAKFRTSECYVKDCETNEGVKLVLVDKEWVKLS